MILNDERVFKCDRCDKEFRVGLEVIKLAHYRVIGRDLCPDCYNECYNRFLKPLRNWLNTDNHYYEIENYIKEDVGDGGDSIQ